MNKKAIVGVCSLLFPLSSFLFTSCEDFFEQESEHVIYVGSEHLNNAVDSIYSVTGILAKLQALGDRTILLGEVRGDLVDVTTVANADLKNLSLFDVDDNNRYNSPRDYYAVINNCNYFIEHADTALRNSLNEYIFMREYGAVKGIRAWTYLQLAINYGRVPFVVEPILSAEDAEKDYPMYDIEDICRYFINDLQYLADTYVSEAFNITIETPLYGSIQSIDSHFFFFPLNVVLGDLHLWLASSSQNKSEYRQAAICYYNYLNSRNGSRGCTTGTNRINWPVGDASYMRAEDSYSTVFEVGTSTYKDDSELITIIPGDSLPADDNYSQLRNLFNSNINNDFKASIIPSQGLIDLSASQKNCLLSKNGAVSYSPSGLSHHRSGDLRLASVWMSPDYAQVTYSNGESRRIDDYQYIHKYSSRNISVMRRQMVYLRMAEALNMAGFPRMAFQILSTGLTDVVMKKEVYKHVSKADSLEIASLNLKFPNTYVSCSENFWTGESSDGNTLGIHSRGSGYTPKNEYYVLVDSVPDATDPTKNVAVPIAEQQAFVDSLILNESALEFCFEGTRYYDIMRYAMRQANPGEAMAKIIYGRRGKDKVAEVKGEIKKDLTNKSNWYLNWNGKLGF